MPLEGARFLIRLEGDEAAAKAATERVVEIVKALQKAGRRIGRFVVDDIRAHFGGPGMPDTRSGWLANSIVARTSKRPSGVRVRIGILKGNPYGPILEIGGVIRPHVIRARRGKLLRWQASASGAAGVLAARRGKVLSFTRGARQKTDEAFAKSVRHPGAKIPPQPFIAPGVLRNRDRIAAEFFEAVDAALRAKAS